MNKINIMGYLTIGRNDNQMGIIKNEFKSIKNRLSFDGGLESNFKAQVTFFWVKGVDTINVIINHVYRLYLSKRC